MRKLTSRQVALLVITFSSVFYGPVFGQESTLVLSTSMFDFEQKIMLADTGNWVFRKGNDISWANPSLNTDDWDTLRPAQLKTEMADENGQLEGWFRLKFRLDSTFQRMEVGIIQKVWAATDIYLNGDSICSFGNTGINGQPYHEYERVLTDAQQISTEVDSVYVLAIHFVDEVFRPMGKLKSEVNVLPGFINITGPEFELNIRQKVFLPSQSAGLTLFVTLAILFWLLYFFNRREKHLMYIAINLTLFIGVPLPTFVDGPGGISFVTQQIFDLMVSFSLIGFLISIPLSVAKIFTGKILRIHWIFVAVVSVYFGR